jgi:hypothetical protein
VWETTRRCTSGFPVQYASWSDIASLRDLYGWKFVSAGTQYTDITVLSPQARRDMSCGSLPAFENRGHTRAWGLFAYATDRSNDAVQRDVVSSCFAYGRKYGQGMSTRSLLGPPWFQSTPSVNGGRCNNAALACYTMAVKGNARYTPLTTLVNLLRPGPNQWNTIQLSRFVTGTQTSPSYPWTWDCSSSDWRNHWVGAVELYCWNDFLAAVDQRPAEVVVTDPATVAEAWSRLP